MCKNIWFEGHPAELSSVGVLVFKSANVRGKETLKVYQVHNAAVFIIPIEDCDPALAEAQLRDCDWDDVDLHFWIIWFDFVDFLHLEAD